MENLSFEDCSWPGDAPSRIPRPEEEVERATCKENKSMKKKEEGLEQCVPAEEEEEDLEKTKEEKENNGDASPQPSSPTTKKDTPPKKIRIPFKKGTDNKSGSSKFEEGVHFRGKLIGVERVGTTRGEQMCQEALQRLKAAVKCLGEHKQRIAFTVSFQGVKIRDEKTGELLHLHPVSTISFICQDNTDARAFGYIFRNDQDEHHFIGIKTEKSAFQPVSTLSELFQTVLNMSSSIQGSDERENKKESDEAASDEKNKENDEKKEEEPSAVPDEPDLLILVDCEDEGKPFLSQEDLEEFTAAEPIFDPFDTSFVSSSENEQVSLPSPLSINSSASISSTMAENKYIALHTLETNPGLFQNPFLPSPNITSPISPMSNPFAPLSPVATGIAQPPSKPPRNAPKSPDDDLFAALDPLSTKGPFDKAHFLPPSSTTATARTASTSNVSTWEPALASPKPSLLSNSFPLSSGVLNPFRAQAATSAAINPVPSDVPFLSPISISPTTPVNKGRASTLSSPFPSFQANKNFQGSPINTSNSLLFGSLSVENSQSPTSPIPIPQKINGTDTFLHGGVARSPFGGTTDSASHSPLNGAKDPGLKRERPRPRAGTSPGNIDWAAFGNVRQDPALSPGEIFAKKADPFADDFFKTSPKTNDFFSSPRLN